MLSRNQDIDIQLGEFKSMFSFARVTVVGRSLPLVAVDHIEYRILFTDRVFFCLLFSREFVVRKQSRYFAVYNKCDIESWKMCFNLIEIYRRYNDQYSNYCINTRINRLFSVIFSKFVVPFANSKMTHGNSDAIGNLFRYTDNATASAHQQFASAVVNNLHNIHYSHPLDNFNLSNVYATSSPSNSPNRRSPPVSALSTKRKRSWSRAVFSQLQRKGLEIQFQIQKYITKPDRRKLAARLGLTDAQVNIVSRLCYFILSLNVALG